MDVKGIAAQRGNYPWAKVFFGFAGGMLFFNIAANLLGEIKIFGILFEPILLNYPQMSEVTFFTLWGLLFLLPMLISGIAVALFLIWQKARRNRRGIALAVKFIISLNIIYAGLNIFYLVFWDGFRGRAQILYFALSYINFVLLQGIFAALLASWLLPEAADDKDEAESYPWRRVILGFGLCTWLFNGLFFWLLLLTTRNSIPLRYFLENTELFFTPSFLFSTWIAWRRFQCTLKHIVFILVVTLPLAMFYFMGITAGSFSYSMHLRSLLMILTARLALTILILSLVFLPAKEDRTASVVDNGVLLLVGILAAAIIIVVSAWIMPYVLGALWQLLR